MIDKNKKKYSDLKSFEKDLEFFKTFQANIEKAARIRYNLLQSKTEIFDKKDFGDELDDLFNKERNILVIFRKNIDIAKDTVSRLKKATNPLFGKYRKEISSKDNITLDLSYEFIKALEGRVKSYEKRLRKDNVSIKIFHDAMSEKSMNEALRNIELRLRKEIIDDFKFAEAWLRALGDMWKKIDFDKTHKLLEEIHKERNSMTNESLETTAALSPLFLVSIIKSGEPLAWIIAGVAAAIYGAGLTFINYTTKNKEILNKKMKIIEYKLNK